MLFYSQKEMNISRRLEMDMWEELWAKAAAQP